MKVKEFFKKFATGACIGVAMIIPGVSGGTIAVLFNVYDKLIGAISDLRRDFKNSFFFLLPIVLGALCGVAALYFPLKYALEYAPMPTILLFAGLMIGSCPKLFKDTRKNGFKKLDIIAFILPLAFVIGICFIPSLGQADLSADMPVWGYFVLLLIGAVASCALVVPGISGSLLLIILGYYTPILDIISALFSDFGHSVLVLALFALGLIVGFFSIAKLMKLLLKKFPRVTGWAIMGFVIGSIPALCLTDEFLTAKVDGVQIAMGAILCLAGVIASVALTAYAEAHKVK
ncbi:MAG: DUF368 domain-containing protein [Clostridia bacterium]|nr:DUF368 domain-containing protein [Clostridia bacterium]